MADAEKKPLLSIAQLVEAGRKTHRDGEAYQEFMAREAELLRRLVTFALSDDIPPAVSLGAQRAAIEYISQLRVNQQANASAEDEDHEAMADAIVALKLKNKREK